LEDYKKCYLDVINLNNDKLFKHWEEIGSVEGRLPNLSLFNYTFPNFNWKLYRSNNKSAYIDDMYKVYGWVFLKNKNNYLNWLKNNNFNVDNVDNVDKIQMITNDGSEVGLEVGSEVGLKVELGLGLKVEDRTGIPHDFNDFILTNNIKYIYVSKALEHFESRMCEKFNLIRYNKLCDKFENVVFFGLYDRNDYVKITTHIGKKFLMWGGTDANTKYNFRKNILNRIKYYLDIVNLSISADINNSLNECGIIPVQIYLNIVNKDIFKQVKIFGKSIYVYNGFTEGNEEIYGKKIYEKVIEKNPEYEYIFSNELNVPHAQMPEIYSKCFIGLRLTEHDGNANTVQEFNSMGIPIIFNGIGGIKWKDADDVIRIIKMYSNNLQT